MPKPILIGIGGGTASGKTTIVDRIAETVRDGGVAILREDWYYKDQSHLSMDERVKTNYDHPDSFEHDLLLTHVHDLLEGRAVDAPTYDFTQHTRARATVRVEPARVVIVEGIMVLWETRLRELMDIKIFVDTDSDLRILRRLKRDVTERGRTIESVQERYLKHVRPMHLTYVDPSRRFADLVIPYGGFNSVIVEILSTIIRDRHSRVAAAPEDTPGGS